MKHIATLSGGKDSTAMIDLLLRNKKPLDYIVFYDTLHEFSLMYQYIKKLSEYFKDRYGKEIITLKPKISFEKMVLGRITKGENKGAIRGLPALQTQGFCYWRRESKITPFHRWIKQNITGEYRVYIGFTTDEKTRKMDDEKLLYPLIDEFKFSERDCFEYLKEREMQNPLYRFFTRTGCYFCPAQSKRAFYELWANFKDEWAYMCEIEARLKALSDRGERVLNAYWFSGFKSCEKMEQEFRLIGGRLDLDDEPLKDCFCKI